jgi:hypothetical protein
MCDFIQLSRVRADPAIGFGFTAKLDNGSHHRPHYPGGFTSGGLAQPVAMGKKLHLSIASAAWMPVAHAPGRSAYEDHRKIRCWPLAVTPYAVRVYLDRGLWWSRSCPILATMAVPSLRGVVRQQITAAPLADLARNGVAVFYRRRAKPR